VTRLLGIDLGRRRIGIAVSDEGAVSARPLATLARGRAPEEDAAALSRLAAEQRAGELVVGLPLTLGGTIGPQAEETMRWAERIGTLTGLPVALRDERLSTDRAEARVGPASRGRAGGPPSAERRRARSARLDREAATLILQAEIDARRSASA
jgi:putative Holliday junction resolvase